MRIGILTLHDSVNYGALAQAYALRCHLAKQGFEACVIDRRRDPGMVAVRTPMVPPEWYRVCGLFKIAANNGARESAVRIARSIEFLRKRVGLTDYSFHDWNAAPKDLGLDCIVVGSDQVWNANNLDPADYLLLRGASAKVPGIAYAASLGMHAIPVEHRNAFREGLAKFKALSVRELEAVELLRAEGFESQHVVDPVLLAGREIWDGILAESPAQGGKVFAYFLAEDFDGLFKTIGPFAASRGKRVDFFTDWYCLKPARKLRQCRRNRRQLKRIADLGIDLRIDAGPDQFVRSLAAADVVITNSYHALMFAVLFGKDVRVVLPSHPVRQAMNSRLMEFSDGMVAGPLIHPSLESALASIDGNHRCVADSERLQAKQQESRNWLAKALSLISMLLVAVCGWAQPDAVDSRVRTYVYPKRVVWQTEIQPFDDGWPVRREAVKMEKLLDHKHGQVSEGIFGSSVGTKLVNCGEAPGVLLDFGRELHGGVQVGISKQCSAGARLRFRFGESVGEAMSSLGDGKHLSNDHSLHDFELEVPRFGSIEVGNTGFRFLRIDLVTGGEVGLEFVRAVSLMRPMKAVGAFRSSDERLNRIYETGVRTVHLCCQEHLWDGIKRDRLVWIGDDSYTAMKAVLPVFGAASVVPETLDYAIATTPPEKWMVLAPYTLWFVRCLADWYRYTGDIAYLRRHGEYLRKTMDHVAAEGIRDGRWTSGDFLDWHTRANRLASQAGLQAVLAMTCDESAFLFAELGETELAATWRARAESVRKVSVQPYGAKLTAALQVQAGMLEAKSAIEGCLAKTPGLDQSPFSGYFIAEVLSASGRQDLALPTVRNYFGAMLDMGATSFWEGFDVAWTNGATRVDEMPVAGRKDIHGDFGEFCYPGFRNSLCHSWGAGISAWCINRVLGIRPLDVGCRTIEVKPDLGDLEWAEGAFALPDGRAVKVKVTRHSNGSPQVSVNAPDGVRVAY